MARTKQTARKSTGGKAPRRVLRLDQLHREVNAVHHPLDLLSAASSSSNSEFSETALFSGKPKPGGVVRFSVNEDSDEEIDLDERVDSKDDVESLRLTQKIKELDDLFQTGFIQNHEYEERKKKLSEPAEFATPKEPVPSIDDNDSLGIASRFGGGFAFEEDSNNMFVGYSKKKSHKSQKGKDRNVRVFISSTFRDMGNEREQIIKHAMPRLRKFCESRGVHLTEVDLRWGITTEQSSQGDTIKICLSEIDKCRPYFVCLLGDRYGWSHSPHVEDKLLDKTFEKGMQLFPWIKDYTDRSITELEIRHAVLNNPSDDMNALFYFREDSSSPPGSQESEDKREKLARLKSEIRSTGYQVTNYNTAEEVANHIEASLRVLLDKEFPEESLLSPLEQERLVHEAFSESRGRVWIGGQKYVNYLHGHLSKPRGAGESITPIYVVGNSGGGKSALLANFVKNYQEKHPDKLAVIHFIGASATSASLAKMLHRVIGEIREFFEDLRTRDLPSDLNSLIEAFPHWLNEAGKRGGMLLVLDALNQLEDGDKTHNLTWLPKKFPNNVALITSTLPGTCLHSLRSRGWLRLRVKPLSLIEREELVKRYMSLFSKSLNSAQVSRLVSADQSESPLFLKILLEELRLFGSFEQLDIRIQQLLSASHVLDLFSMVFTRLEDDFSNVIGDVLACIYTARRGLAESELLDIMKIPQALWSALSLALQEYVVNRSGVLTFPDYFRQAVEYRYLTSERKKCDYHDKLMQYFEKQEFSKRQVEELPYHALKSDDYDSLAQYITDLDAFELLYTPDSKLDLFNYWRKCVDEGAEVEDLLLENIERLEALVDPDDTLTTYLTTAGKFLEEMACFKSSKRLYKRALSLSESIHLPDHADVATKLNFLGYLYRITGKFVKSATAYERALSIRERVLNEKDPDLAQNINGLAILYRQQGRYREAEPLYVRALTMRELVLGSNHPDVAQSLNSLACLYQDQGKYDMAEKNFSQALQIREMVLGERHPDVGMSLNNLAALYSELGRFSEAEPLLERTLKIEKEAYGTSHPDVAKTLNTLAGLYTEQARYDQAVKLYKEALEISESLLGEKHPDNAIILNDWAVLYVRMEQPTLAIPLYERASRLREEMLGPNHPDTAQSINNLASLYVELNMYDKAEPLFYRATNIYTNAFGSNHPDVAQTNNNLCNLYQRQGKSFEFIAPIYENTLKNLTERVGATHPDVALTLNDFAILNFTHGKITEAEKLYIKAVDTFLLVFGKDHPDYAQALKNLADFYDKVGQSDIAASHRLVAGKILKEAAIRKLNAMQHS